MNDSQPDRSDQVPAEGPARTWTAPTFKIHTVEVEGGATPARSERVLPGLTYRLGS